MHQVSSILHHGALTVNEYSLFSIFQEANRTLYCISEGIIWQFLCSGQCLFFVSSSEAQHLYLNNSSTGRSRQLNYNRPSTIDSEQRSVLLLAEVCEMSCKTPSNKSRAVPRTPSLVASNSRQNHQRQHYKSVHFFLRFSTLRTPFSLIMMAVSKASLIPS